MPRRASGTSSGGSSEAADLDALIAARRREQGYDQRGERPEPKPPAPVADGVFASIAKLADPETLARAAAVEERRIDEAKAYIVRRVNCPQLRGSNAYRLAEAVVRGKIPRHKAINLLDNLDRKQPDSRSAYFNNGVKYLFLRYGVSLSEGG